MLLAPHHSRLNLQSIPWVSLLVALIWVAVFFLVRASSSPVTAEALRIYEQSTLPSTELPRYRDWLRIRTDAASRQRLQTVSARDVPVATIVDTIESDARFLRELRRGDVIRPDEPSYERWRDDRLRFEAVYRSSPAERLQLRADTGQPWRLMTHAVLFPTAGALVLGMLALLIAGPFAEAALGRARYVVTLALAATVAGGAHLIYPATPWRGAAAVGLAAAGAAWALHGFGRVPTLIWAGPLKAMARLPVWLLCVAAMALLILPAWTSALPLPPALGLAIAAVTGGALAWLLRPAGRVRGDPTHGEVGDEARAERRYSLARQAQEAASKLDTRRAVRLYRELVEGNPDHAGYLAQYFNMALMAHDPETLADASLRVLWMRNRGAADELRKVYLQMSQPNVLKTLPVDEQLRLSRRLVRTREDAAALKVLDSILTSEHLRNLYGRQIADCLLGLFTTYTRYGLRQQADNVRTRLKTYFPQPTTIGGLAPNTKPPSTIRGTSSNTAGPSTLFIDLSR